MAIEEKTRAYEILIRLNEDGTYGAQYQTITEIVKDGKVIQATPNAAQPLSVAGDDAGVLLSGVLGDVATDALMSNQFLQAKIAELNLRIADLTQDPGDQ